MNMAPPKPDAVFCMNSQSFSSALPSARFAMAPPLRAELASNLQSVRVGVD